MSLYVMKHEVTFVMNHMVTFFQYTDMAKKNSIIIIGAGIAGLSAAEILTSSGFEFVTILEARNRIGGRVHVREHDENTIHMGAQWIHQYCPENSMAQVAKK